MPGRVIIQGTKDAIAEVFIKAACLKTISVEPRGVTSHSDGLGLHASEQLASKAQFSELLWNDEHFHIEVGVPDACPNASYNAVSITEDEDYGFVVAREAQDGFVEAVETLQDRFAVLFSWRGEPLNLNHLNSMPYYA
jgi:hypothetical protein